MHLPYLTTADPFVKLLIPALAIFLVFVFARIKHISSEQLLLRKPALRSTLMWTAICVAYILLTDLLLNWRGKFDFQPWRDQPLGVSLARILAVCFLGPIAEELVFRRILFMRLSRLIKNEWAAIAIIAVGWAFIHIEYDLTIHVLIMIEGLILGAAMLTTRSLYVPILLHIIWNLYAVW